MLHWPAASYEKWSNPDFSTILANLALCTNLFYKHNLIGVLWTLPLEVQMYIFLPICYLIGKRYKIQGIGALWFLAVIAALIQPRVAGRLDIAQYVPCFLAGVASYFIGFGVIKKRLPFIGWPITIAIAALVLRIADTFGFGSAGSWLMCLIVGLAAPLFVDLEWKPLQKGAAWIARYSYGIYLVHLHGLWLGIDVMSHHSLWLRTLIAVAISFGLPIALYHFLEAPMIKLGGRLANRIPERALKLTPAVES